MPPKHLSSFCLKIAVQMQKYAVYAAASFFPIQDLLRIMNAALKVSLFHSIYFELQILISVLCLI